MDIPMMLAQAVALSLAGEADARLKYSVTARQQSYRHHPTTKEQNDQCQTLKNFVLRAVHTMWNDSTSPEPQLGFTRSLLEMVILAFR